MSIVIPEGWVKVDDPSNVIERLSKGETLLSTLSDLMGIYAASVFSKKYNNIRPKDKDYKDFFAFGEWYEQMKD